MSNKNFHQLSVVVSFWVMVLFSGIFLFPYTLHAFDYVLGTGTYPMVSHPKPAKGASFVDSPFGTTITRITDWNIDSLINNRIGQFQLGLYDMHSSLNCDDTWLLVMGEWPNYFLYGGPAHPTKPFKLDRMLPGISQSSGPCYVFSDQTPVWDSSDPNVFYFLMRREAQGRPDTCPTDPMHGPKIWKYTVNTGTVSLVHDFTKDSTVGKWFQNQKMPTGVGAGYYYIDWEEYNKPSKDRRYWALSIYFYDINYAQWVACAIYDKTLDKIVAYTEDSTVFLKGYNKGYHEVSPSGTRIVVRETGPYGGNFYKICDMNYNVLFKFRAGHFDVATDVEGRDVAVGQLFAYNDSIDYWAWIDLLDGTVYGIKDNGVSIGSALHVSASNYSKYGWAFWNTYETLDHWCSEQIVATQLDRSKAVWKVPWMPGQGNGNNRVLLNPPGTPKIWRVAHHHMVTNCYVPSGYANQAHGGISLSGKYFVYGGNWEQCPKDMSNYPLDVYMIALPPTWWEDLKGNIQRDITPPAKPTGLKVVK